MDSMEVTNGPVMEEGVSAVTAVNNTEHSLKTENSTSEDASNALPILCIVKEEYIPMDPEQNCTSEDLNTSMENSTSEMNSNSRKQTPPKMTNRLLMSLRKPSDRKRTSLSIYEEPEKPAAQRKVKWNEENMRKAILACRKMEMGVFTASKHFNVPYKTLSVLSKNISLTPQEAASTTRKGALGLQIIKAKANKKKTARTIGFVTTKLGKNYSCRVCTRPFSNPAHVIRHEKIHKTRPFSCIDCSRYFISEEAYIDHMKQKHKGKILNRIQMKSLSIKKSNKTINANPVKIHPPSSIKVVLHKQSQSPKKVSTRRNSRNEREAIANATNTRSNENNSRRLLNGKTDNFTQADVVKKDSSSSPPPSVSNFMINEGASRSFLADDINSLDRYTSPKFESLRSNRHIQFFEGILPSLQNFSEDQVIDFQMGVLNIIKTLRK